MARAPVIGIGASAGGVEALIRFFDAMPAELRRRFFDPVDSSYQVRQELRDLIAFAPQNLLRDPPFSRMDLVSCRNLLIYLEPKIQQRVIALAHFALREGGYLFLGNAETIGRNDGLFETLSKKWRIYRRLGPTRHDIVDFPVGRQPQEPTDSRTAPAAAEQAPAAAETAQRALIEQYAPAIDRGRLHDRCAAARWCGTGRHAWRPTAKLTVMASCRPRI